MTSVGVNCAIVFFTSNSLPDILVSVKDSKLSMFMLIVMIEHIIIVFKYFISAMINDKPSWVKHEERQAIEEEEAIKVQMELKREQYKQNGEVPLDEIIEMMKTTQSKTQRDQEEDYLKSTKVERLIRKREMMEKRISLQDILEARKIK